jgi:hypothetical protein
MQMEAEELEVEGAVAEEEGQAVLYRLDTQQRLNVEGR